MSDRPEPPVSSAANDSEHTYIVELLVVVEAKNVADAEHIGERARLNASRASGRGRVVNVILSDVRSDEE